MDGMTLYKNPDMPPYIEIRVQKLKGKSLFVKTNIKRGQIIFQFTGRTGPDQETNPESLQIDSDTYWESSIIFDDYLNHGCEPNCYVDFKTMCLIAKRNIKLGEELTCNYNEYEYDLINMVKDCSFTCYCGSKKCYKEIKGFRYLPLREKLKIKRHLAPFLKRKLQEGLRMRGAKIKNSQKRLIVM
jgi:hypothetical protein